jgi:transposase
MLNFVMKLLLEDRFPKIWVPSPENRDLRQLLWHRNRMVQMRTRVMNQLQSIAMKRYSAKADYGASRVGNDWRSCH